MLSILVDLSKRCCYQTLNQVLVSQSHKMSTELSNKIKRIEFILFQSVCVQKSRIEKRNEMEFPNWSVFRGLGVGVGLENEDELSCPMIVICWPLILRWSRDIPHGQWPTQRACNIMHAQTFYYHLFDKTICRT